MSTAADISPSLNIMAGLTEGRIVHFVLPDTPNKGECRAGIVVRVWRVGPRLEPPENGMVNLVVFLDGSNDHRKMIQTLLGTHAENEIKLDAWHTSITYSREKDERSWHWPHECQAGQP